MHAALLANTAWLDEELSTLRQLAVGLVDEQVRVVQVIPSRAVTGERAVFGEQLTWRETRWEALSLRRLARLDQPLQSLGVDVVHALDGRLWAPAAKLAQELDIAAVFSANSKQDVRRAPRIARRINPARSAFTAATGPLAEALRQRLEPAQMVELVPPGIHVPRQPPEPRPEGGPTCLVISGNGQRDELYDALLQALRQLVSRYPETQLFFDGQGAEQHTVWKAVSEMGLLGQSTFVPRRLSRRELLLRADALVLPQALGRARSMTLRAYAAGLPVLAQVDPWLDYQIQDRTAWVVDSPQPDRWVEHLRRLIHEPAQAAALGQRAKAWVSEHRLASSQVGKVLGVYRAVTGTAIPFTG